VIDEALERGYELTLFNRGTTRPELYPELERIVGDRDGGLDGLRGRSWDAVVDTSGYIPRIVRASAEALAGSVERYVFVSSVSVYASFGAPVTETSPVAALDDPSTEDVQAAYGALKAACETAVGELFPDRSVHVRAGLIVGPHDPTGRFTYWPHRIARGGDVLVPGSLARPVQLVDVRDLAAWMLDVAAGGPTGAVNVVSSHTMRDVFDAAVTATGSDAAAVEVDEAYLVEREVGQWVELPLWVDTRDPDWGSLMHADTSRALAAGFAPRPLENTVRATLDHAQLVEGVGLSEQREASLLAEWTSQSDG
jgi:nucleoside-diphosphate-sugar epimerase